MEPIHADDEVFNQTPPLTDYNLFTTDPVLQEAVRREGAQPAAAAALADSGAALGTAENFEHARLANRYTPVLHSFSVQGERIDSIEFHPSWHILMQGIAARGYHSGPWATVDGRAIPGAHVARAAGYLMQAQVECGTLCPTTMTYGAIAAMRRDPLLARDWVPRLLTREYDPRDIPIAHKRGGLIGMGMTEKQGGSDVRANTSRARRSADGSYRISGHKWFFSAPQCDAHLVLAQTEGGLTCLFLPRRLPDGTRNGIHIQRLKDKLGNRSNASSEVEFIDAWAQLLGEEGRGIPTILEMGTYTRLDCVTGTAGMMRAAVVQAMHHARHRKAFGALLVDQPLMQSVLADLAIESEAAAVLAMRLARAFDSDAEGEIALRRALTSAAKFWVCKRGCELAAEAMEVLGGNGYTEELPLARIAREMPVNSIWEGSGNIMCLDVLRAFAKSTATRDAVLNELEGARGRHRNFDASLDRFADTVGAGTPTESEARRFTQRFVTLMQAALLLNAAANPGARAVAEGFCATRLDADSGWGAVFGGSGAALDIRAILRRAWDE
ncbi:MAG TPA: isovaleryl-CoA dehydrogenase [Steroidobacteraceae bacterium]|jgi:putative acyl-CoA dehydrogenase|nr:isovaleryl-CoA dehydrogenase [Steroidobacteraceae bacterium]